MGRYKSYSNIDIGKNSKIDDFCIIGRPPKGKKDGDLATQIGDNCIIRPHTVIYSGNKIGDDFQTGQQVSIRENNNIGNNVSIGTGSCIEHNIVIEDDVRLHSQVFIPEYSELKENCWIGPNVVFTNAKYPLSKNVKENLKGPTIEENAIVGANATLLPGIKVGKNALIGAGSVVENDVPKGKVVAGNPARIIKNIEDIEEYNF